MKRTVNREKSTDRKRASRMDKGVATKIIHRSEREIALLIEKALDEGLLQEDEPFDTCPNCGAFMDGPFCEICNQSTDDPEILDGEPDDKDDNLESISESDIADEGLDLEEPRDKLPPSLPTMSFKAYLQDYFDNYNISPHDADVCLFIIDLMVQKKGAFSKKFPPQDQKQVATHFSLAPEQVNRIWQACPLSIEDLSWLFVQWQNDPFMRSPEMETTHIGEIKRSGKDLIPIVFNPFHHIDVLPASIPQGTIPVDQYEITGSLLLDSIRARYETLHKILNALITLRRDFFHFNTAAEAEASLQQKAVQQNDIADEADLDKSVISHYFKTYQVKTPHGIYPLSHFTLRKSDDHKNQVIDLIAKTDQEYKFYSDNKIAGLMGNTISREQVKHIRKHHKPEIPNSSDRKKNAITQITVKIMEEYRQNNETLTEKQMAKKIRTEGIKVTLKELKSIIRLKMK